MKPSIAAIFFDVGGTLRMSQSGKRRDLNIIRQLQAVIGDSSQPAELAQALLDREKEYRRWARKTQRELTEHDLWARFMLPEAPEPFLQENAVLLNQMWRDSSSRQLLPDAVTTIRALAARGYRLGIISNTTSSIEVPRLLRENDITDLFKIVILSCVNGRRKPHPSLFLQASRAVGLLPENCAYLGDKTARDLVGARQAGYGEAGLINTLGYSPDDFDPDDEALPDTITEMQPDFRIGQLSELLDRYPPLNHLERKAALAPQQIPTLYDAALSTMWGVGQDMPFDQTFAAGRQAGFIKFELNHQISPELYDQWDASRYYISTVHDPCPAEKSAEQLKREDLLISSLDESRRVQGVDILKRTVELAVRLGAQSVVVHPGTIMGDRSRDHRLRELYQEGLRGSAEYRQLASELIAHRASLAAPHLEQVVKSLDEILAFTRGSGVAIALENRYRYYDIPLADEMETLLALSNADWYGFQYDVGHAQALDALGLASHQEWLERFSRRMIGAHLHDVIGTTDHQAPGGGEIDFQKIASWLPETALITLEVGPQASIQDLTRGLEVLTASGCVKRI